MLEEFAASRRAEATRKGYPKMMKLLIPDPDAFLLKAKEDRRGAEDELIRAIVRRRDGVSPATINGSVSTLKSFFDFEEVQLNWKKVRSVTPAGKAVAKDRAPTVEELRGTLKLAAPRERAAMLVMASGGLRIGALPGLKLKDIEYLKTGIGKVTVYAGEAEEYQAFVTPECVDAIKDYMASRERVGEKMAPDSLLFRDKFDYQGDRRQKKVSPAVPHPVNEHALRTTILRLWQRAGVRRVNDGRPFKCDHGLRKFAKTQMSRAGMKWEDSEVLLGHAFNYNKPSVEHLEEEYRKAVPFLSIDEKYTLRTEVESQKQVHESEWKRTRVELLEYKEALSQLTALVREMKAEREMELSRKGSG